MEKNTISDPGSTNDDSRTIEVREPQQMKIETPEDVREWKSLPAWQGEIARTETNTRKWISYAIVFVFVAWAIGGGVYLMFFKGDIQVLITGSAFISGPLGVVIGYYFGVGEDRKR